ncbi:hypothetical protein Q8A67_009698 [Cirrhinus molitorella]|uniref:SRCR domain-containing protein n=1 Tax=Cirrhinus molitorella TaxID=172907 RepID=A0AA88PNE7_9TELE|nr:hypothetical protein Q8A67_009698 [Cirrhinus molitorella]
MRVSMWLYADLTALVKAGWKCTTVTVAVTSSGAWTRYKDKSLPQQYWMDQVKCTSKEASLWDCPYVHINTKSCDQGSFIAVECSGSVTLSLNLNGQRDKCAGVVEFSTPSGTVGVCRDKWDEKLAKKICQELSCGDHAVIPKPGIFKRQQSKQNVVLQCVGNEKYSWQCIEWSKGSDCKEPASVICTNHKKFRLQGGSNVCSGLVEEYNFKENSWDRKQTDKMSPDVICTQMNCGSTGNFTNVNGSNILTCSGSVKLHNFTNKCYGDVSIDVNGTNYGVCYSNPTHEMGKVVCRELGCGEVLHVEQVSSSYKFLLSNIDCKGDEEALWHCLASREETQCFGTKVICAGSLDVRLSDGLGDGRCSGRVEVQWEGSWRSIGSDWTAMNADVVCQHLSCGTSDEMPGELFIEGSELQLGWLSNVRCTSSSAKLHECFNNIQLRSPHQNEKSREIICKKEEVMFFEGDSPCKGRVLIKSFDAEARYLPAKPAGGKTTKTQDICKTMGCGSLVSSIPSEQDITHANVTCSGSVSVTLQEKCWGMVNVCRGNCGGVCQDTWTEGDSQKICENLGCGNSIKFQLTHTGNVNYYSVYCQNQQNMSMCNFIPIKDHTCKTPAQVVCTESVKARLEDPRDKCAGNVLLFYAGKWTPVCHNSLDANLENAICEELVCGKSKSGKNDRISRSQIQGLSGINCKKTDNSVSKCDFNKVSKQDCTAGYLKCTEWERLLLYNKEGECSGPVYGLRGGKTQLVSEEGWGREEGQKLCEYLQCGNYISHSAISKNTEEWWKKTYNCSGKTHIWDCESNDQPTSQQQLSITCDRKPPNIMLSNNCTGKVLIEKEHVCESQWDGRMSDSLCDSLKCGKSISHWGENSETKIAWHFSCTDKETSMWQCGSKQDSCTNILSVACEGSVEFSTTEKCGGKLGIKYKERWEYVCGNINPTDTKKVCEALNCNNSQKLLDELTMATEKMVTIKCPQKHYKLSQCVQQKGQCSGEDATIECDGYVPKESNSSVSLILGLLGGVLGLLILFLMWINRKRLLLVLRKYRNKNGKDMNTDVKEMDKMDREDGGASEHKASFSDHDEYEDVDSFMDKSGEEEDDYRKRGSSGTEYDDIEGQDNDISPSKTHHDEDFNLPLLPKRPENILDQDTYEVEIEKQDDYDDVVSVEDGANENAGTTGRQAHLDVDSDAGPGANADAMLVTAEVEVHAQPE